MSGTKLSLAPVQWHWSAQALEQYYQSLLNHSHYQRVTLGDSVCVKRRLWQERHWRDIAAQLSTRHEVVMTTRPLLTDEQEIRALAKLIDDSPYLFEANDMATVALLAQAKRPFVVGPWLPQYSAQSLQVLLELGMKTWVAPVEISAKALRAIIDDLQQLGIRDEFAIEYWGYGHLPLSHSARCFSTRIAEISKDDCQQICQNYPQGITLRSLEQQELIIANGVQVQSSHIHNCINEISQLNGLVDYVRISAEAHPQQHHIAQLFQHQLQQPIHHALLANEANGYWYGLAGHQRYQ